MGIAIHLDTAVSKPQSCMHCLAGSGPDSILSAQVGIYLATIVRSFRAVSMTSCLYEIRELLNTKQDVPVLGCVLLNLRHLLVHLPLGDSTADVSLPDLVPAACFVGDTDLATFIGVLRKVSGLTHLVHG